MLPRNRKFFIYSQWRSTYSAKETTPCVKRLQEVENNGKLYNHQAKTWSRLLMGGDRLREVVAHGGSTVL